jgi:hypothetical protein
VARAAREIVKAGETGAVEIDQVSIITGPLASSTQ